MNNKNIFIRQGTVIILIIFTLSSTSLAATKNLFDSKTRLAVTPAAEEKSPKDTATIAIPEEIGLIKDSFRGNGDGLIIHIQDAHCNYEAQTNISKILEILTENNGLELISVEGSAGEIDTSLFTTFPDTEIRKEVSNYFMKKGKISGAEYFAINTKKEVLLYGCENKDYYLENLRAFTTTLPRRGAAKKVCDEIRSCLNELKTYIYNKDLKDFEGKISDYNEDRMKFVDFCLYLNKQAASKKIGIEKYANFACLINALKLEKEVDFDKVDSERSAVISELEKKLKQEELSELFMKSLSYRTKKISASEYYSYLKKLAAQAKVPLSNFKNFNLYIDYLSVYAKIDNPSLFRELKGLEDDVREALYTNTDQKKLNTLSKNIRLVEELLDISLSNEDAEYLTQNAEQFKSSQFTSFINQQSSKYALAYSATPNARIIDEVLPSLEKFYEVAGRREDALLENTLKKMGEKKAKVAVLVSGGYHTDGLSQRLKNKGISYMVVAPRITDLKAESPYLEIISGAEKALE